MSSIFTNIDIGIMLFITNILLAGIITLWSVRLETAK